MSNPYFRFKRFTVYHDRCAMKVGTDGTLLGAWAGAGDRLVCYGRPYKTGRYTTCPYGEGWIRSVLDVGTGCGLIALMIAQRFPLAKIVGIDTHEASVRQASENAAATDWGDRLTMACRDVRDLTADDYGRFDLIVSNPPFYEEDVYCPDGLRNSARHTDSLSFEELVDTAVRLTNDNGRLSVVLPASAKERFVGVAARRGFYLSRLTNVFTKTLVRGLPKRVLMEFTRQMTDTVDDDLYIYNKGVFTEEYVSLLKEFYLNL